MTKTYKLMCSDTFLKNLAKTSKSCSFIAIKHFRYARHIDDIATAISEHDKLNAILIKVKYWTFDGTEYFIKIWVPKKYIDGDKIIEKMEDGTLWIKKK